ncbi:MAG: hypothetical protein L0G48_08705, partial [Staphylococcus equorum]|nr:hypothetical protein [Staphylococcus equorum]
MKYPYTSLFTILAISISFSGCAITSGLQTYDLPEQGQYKTDQGAELSVVQLNQNNIPNPNTADRLNSNNLVSLFSPKNTTYHLSPGDI